MIDAQACIPWPPVAKVAPKRVRGPLALLSLERVCPSLLHQFSEGRARLWLQKGVVFPGRPRVDVVVSGNHIEIAGKNCRMPGPDQCGSMPIQALKPRHLVVEFRTGPWVAIREIQARHHNAVHGCFQVSALLVRWISGQPAAYLQGRCAARKDRHAVPGFLAVHQRLIPCAGKLVVRELRFGAFQLLETHDVRLGDIKPSAQLGKSCDDVVNVVGGYSHKLLRMAGPKPPSAFSPALLSLRRLCGRELSSSERLFPRLRLSLAP